ncbi:hypothetical protein AVEN_145765-1 [Araneus ventricosus]|uniref:Uncharacterized protein n=1 Tax=Araneus ventricosus TaxID=182803 RepID=A0A4Y2IRF3_ARAVE|nr:hypothetical protein AVEN_145765-1 [Araneus ventricosus]
MRNDFLLLPAQGQTDVIRYSVMKFLSALPVRMRVEKTDSLQKEKLTASAQSGGHACRCTVHTGDGMAGAPSWCCVNFVNKILSTRSSAESTGVSYTEDFMCAKKKKSSGLGSGERGGQSTSDPSCGIDQAILLRRYAT